MTTIWFGSVRSMLPQVGGYSWKIATAVVVMAITSPAMSATVVYDFDDGTLQGWTNILTSINTPVTAWEASNRTDAAGSAQSGSYRLLPNPPAFGAPNFVEDSPHMTLLVRSPEFQFGANGSISFFLDIGVGGAVTPGPDFASLPTNSSSSGYMGAALRRVSDGAYLLSQRKSGNGIGWQQRDFTNQAIIDAGLIGVPLTLDLIESYHGGFGWLAADTFTLNDVNVVPEPVSILLSLLASLSCVPLLRRTAKRR